LEIQLTIQFTNLLCDQNRKFITKLFVFRDFISEQQKNPMCFYSLNIGDQ